MYYESFSCSIHSDEYEYQFIAMEELTNGEEIRQENIQEESRGTSGVYPF